MGKKNRPRRKRKLAQKTARKKRIRRTSKGGVKSGTLAPSIHTIHNPFAGLSDEQRRLAIEEVAKKSEVLYREALSDLRNLLGQHNPLLVLSIMASYGLTSPVDQVTGVTKLDSDCDLYPFHVEILQALCLQIEPADLSGAPFGPDVPSQVREKIKALCDAHNFRRLAPDGADLPDDEKTVALAQQLIRANTQAVRNWGVPLPNQANRTRTLLSIRYATNGSQRFFRLGCPQCVRESRHRNRIRDRLPVTGHSPTCCDPPVRTHGCWPKITTS